MIAYEARAAAVLHNLLRSLPDDRPFLLPANVCTTVPLTLLAARRRFECVDIGGPDLAMDPERCLDRLEKEREGFAGVLYVRTYGAAGDAEPFFAAAKGLRPDLLLIDDRCLCPPDLDGAVLSRQADVTLFSTGRAKHVDLGFGGFAHLKEHVPYRRFAGRYDEDAEARVERRAKEDLARRRPFAGGGEDWLDLSAPALPWEEYRLRALAALAEADEHKGRLNAIYRSTLPPEIQLPARFHGWRFQVLAGEPDRLVERLFAEGLFASRHYASLGGVFCSGSFPAAEALHARVVNLFNDRYFDEEKACRAAAIAARHVAGRG